MYDLVIFDCDGTLTDSEEGYYKTLCATLDHFSLPVISLDYYQLHYSGSVVSDIVEKHFGSRDAVPDGFIQYYFSREAEFVLSNTKAIYGAGSAVAAIEKKFKTAIASNANVKNITAGLKKEGLIRYFPVSHIFSKDMVKLPKPAPDVFLYTARKMAARPERTLVIEDSVTGVEAGKAAGMTVIGFSGSSHDAEGKHRLLDEAGADIVFPSWKDILNHINARS